MLTRDCNLACAYCFAGAKARERLTYERGLDAIDRALALARELDEPLEVSFFGGEPLLEWELVERLAREARARADAALVPLSLQVTTNGLLLDDERLRALTELDVHVALSLDGAREAHDRLRVNLGGRGSYDQVARALDRLLQRGLPFDVISVVDPRTIDLLAQGVRELLDRGVERLTLNLNWGAAWSSERLELLSREYESVAALVVAWFRRGRAVVVQPFDSALVRLARAEEGPITRCGAGERSFALAPSGRLYGCARAVGEDTGAHAIGTLDRWADATSRARSGRADGGCAEGGCACASMEETGDASEAGPVQRFHDELVRSLAPRIAGALEQDELGRATFDRAFGPRCSGVRDSERRGADR